MLNKYVKETTADRDYYRKETQNLLEAKLKLEKQTHNTLETFKKRLMELDRELKQKTEESNDTFEAK